MPEYRRAQIEGGTYFFTVVTYKRRKIFHIPEARKILGDAFRDVKIRYPFTMDAVCILPDHIHCIWTLPENDKNFSVRWKEIKRHFSKSYHLRFGNEKKNNLSHEKRVEAEIWQRRFWEHCIQDEEDLFKHLDYIHYNPVKHTWVKNVCDWPWSSFKRYVRMGYYELDWGSDIEEKFKNISLGE